MAESITVGEFQKYLQDLLDEGKVTDDTPIVLDWYDGTPMVILDYECTEHEIKLFT